MSWQSTIRAFVLSGVVSVSCFAVSPMNRLREGYMILAGYASEAIYTELNTNSNIPSTGLVGVLESLLSEMETQLISAGITKCATNPDSGGIQYTGSGGVTTVLFRPPSLTIPTGWRNAGEKFQNRFELANGENEVAFEYTCGEDRLYIESIRTEVTDTRKLLYITDRTEYPHTTEMYVLLTNSSGVFQSGQVSRLYVYNDNTYQYWTAFVYGTSGIYAGERAIVHGNYSSGEASFYMHMYEAADAITITDNGAGGSSTPSTAIITGFGDDRVQGNTAFTGCINFKTPTTIPSTTTTCTSLTLNNASPGPHMSSTATFSWSWLYNGLSTVMNSMGIN